jgi:hypothetical protein
VSRLFNREPRSAERNANLRETDLSRGRSHVLITSSSSLLWRWWFLVCPYAKLEGMTP